MAFCQEIIPQQFGGWGPGWGQWRIQDFLKGVEGGGGRSGDSGLNLSPKQRKQSAVVDLAGFGAYAPKKIVQLD